MILPRSTRRGAGSLEDVRVAAVQTLSLPDAAAQALILERLLNRPALEGADLIVLPEAAHRGFGGVAALSGDAEALDGPFVTMIHHAARRGGAVVVAGMFEQSGTPGRPFNTTVVVGPEGLRGVYRKVHLYDALGFEESTGITPGGTDADNVVVTEVAGWRVGVQTCFDLRFPETTRRLVLAGADVLVVGAAWLSGPNKVEQFDVLTKARANESTAYLVAAAQPAPRYCGHSRIVDPRGSLLVETDATSEAIVVAQLSDETLAEVRTELPLLRARRLGIEAP